MAGLRHPQRLLDLAALSLYPPNFDRTAALGALAVRADSAVPGWRCSTAEFWRALFRTPSGRAAASRFPEAIVDRPVVNEVALSGAPFIVANGRSNMGGIAARLLGGALDRVLADRSDSELHRARDVLVSGLELGEAVALRAGWQGLRWPRDHGLRGIAVPDEPTLNELRSALVFERDQFSTKDMVALSDLIGDERDAIRRPIVRGVGGRLFVVAPHDLASWALAESWRRICASGAFEAVELALIDLWQAEILAMAELCDWSVARVESAGPPMLHIGLDEGTSAQLVLLLESTDALGERVCMADTMLSLPALEVRTEFDNEEVLCTIVAALVFGRRARLDHASVLADRPLWLVDAQALQYLMEASRLDPLGLVRMHRMMNPRAGSASSDLLDIYGLARGIEDSYGIDPPEVDPTELTIVAARANARRNVAPGWQEPSWAVEIVRYPKTVDESLFMPALPDSHLRLAARDDHVTFWVGTAAPVKQIEAAEPVLVHVLCSWVSRIMTSGLFALHDKAMWTSWTVAYDSEAEQALHRAHREGHVRLTVGRPFLRLAAQGDNAADRLLVGEVIDSLAGLNGDLELRSKLIDHLAPYGPATMIFWNDPEADVLPPSGQALPLVSNGAKLVAGVALAEFGRYRRRVGLWQGAAAKDALNDVIRDGFGLLAQGIVESTPDLLTRLITLTGVAASEAERHAIQHPAVARLSLFKDFEEMLQQRVHEPGLARTALRFLVEHAHARPPSGRGRVNSERLDGLRGLAEELLMLAAASDTQHSELARLRLAIGPSGPLVYSLDGEALDARQHQWQLVMEQAPEALMAEHRAWWADEGDVAPDLGQPISLDGKWLALSEAMQEELGFSLDALLRVGRAIAEPHLGTDEAVTARRSDLLSGLPSATGLDAETCQQVIDRLTLRRDPAYDPLRPPFQPWRTGRPAGYVIEPLVECGEEQVIFAAAHVLVALKQQFNRFLLARNLPPRGPTAQAASRLANEQASDWEAELARRLEDQGLAVRLRARRVGGEMVSRPDGSSLGDFDVLAYDAAGRTIWALDAKNITAGTSPMSIPAEAGRLAKEAQKLAARIGWLEEHRAALAAEFAVAVDEAPGLRIEAALVLASPLAGAPLVEDSVRVLSWQELRQVISGGHAADHA